MGKGDDREFCRLLRRLRFYQGRINAEPAKGAKTLTPGNFLANAFAGFSNPHNYGPSSGTVPRS
jgi:hypothetical protein